MRSDHVVLIGEMGVGKTTVGRNLAAVLGCNFFDSDGWIEATQGRSGADIAGSEGVPYLHQLELRALEAGLAEDGVSVIAAAASVADTDQGQTTLAGTSLVWLDATEEVLDRRRQAGDHRRSQTEDERKKRRSRRHGIWQDLADIRVDTSQTPPEDVVSEIVSRLSDVEA